MYFINKYVFHTEEYEEGINIYNIEFCIRGSISNKFEVDYYDKLQKVIELRYHRLQDIMFLFKYYRYDID
jgi:hypothetical protein